MRPIDADALLKEYDGAEYEINSSAYAKGCNDVVKWSRKTINEQPTIDAVPVVRCGECEFWERDRISCEGVARCRTGESGVRFRAKHDYCSRGILERKAVTNDALHKSQKRKSLSEI